MRLRYLRGAEGIENDGAVGSDGDADEGGLGRAVGAEAGDDGVVLLRHERVEGSCVHGWILRGTDHRPRNAELQPGASPCSVTFCGGSDSARENPACAAGPNRVSAREKMT
jgi:hypothetical protein